MQICETEQPSGYDYVVVGSGAGGGTVAARLAEAGLRVAPPRSRRRSAALQGGDPRSHGQPPARRLRRPRLPRLRVGKRGDEVGLLRPPLHEPGAAEARSEVSAKMDGKRVDGVLYPRAGTLGGCTAHNAMITDLSAQRRLGPDRRADRRSLLARRATCAAISSGWRTAATALVALSLAEPARHQPHAARLRRLAADREGRSRDRPLGRPQALHATCSTARCRRPVGDCRGAERLRLLDCSAAQADPNDWRLVRDDAMASAITPLATRNHAADGHARARARSRPEATPTG